MTGVLDIFDKAAAATSNLDIADSSRVHRAWKSIKPADPVRRAEWPEIALILAALGCAALAAVRVACSISFSAPLQLVTSGAEEDALASIWRFAHGQAVYTDPHLIPFTGSYFNWLFYVSYGLAAKSLLATFHLGDAWLPTVCRLLTLLLAVAGVALAARLIRSITGRNLSWPVTLALAALALINPLCGFWIVTTRPDLGATVLELAGVACALRHRQEQRPRWIVAAALFFAVAWAFKQTAIGACTGVVLAAALPSGQARGETDDHPWNNAILLGITLGTSLLACAFLGPIYRHGLFFSQINSGFHLRWGLLHFGSALGKMPFIAVALAGAALSWRQASSDPVWRTVTLVLAAEFLVNLVTSCKGGAGDYYLIPVGLWSVVWLALALTRLRARWLGWAVALAALLQLAAIASVLTGQRGTINPRDPTQPYEHLAARLLTRPGPVFVRDTYGDLPWISPSAPHFVVGFNNQVDQLAGAKLQGGGWQGLMTQGYFATVVTRIREPFPQALLARYRPDGNEAGWLFFARTDSAAARPSREDGDPNQPTSPRRSHAASR